MMINKIIGISLIALIIGGCTTTSNYFGKNTMIIRQDNGGVVAQYKAKIFNFKQSGGTHVVIDGECYSACVLWLHRDFGLNVCATPNAKIGFHMPYSVNQMTRQIDRSLNSALHSEIEGRYIINGMPKPLKNYWNTNYMPSVYKGNAPSDMSIVSGYQAVDLVGDC